jgi:hypothetical protein
MSYSILNLFCLNRCNLIIVTQDTPFIKAYDKLERYYVFVLYKSTALNIFHNPYY